MNLHYCKRSKSLWKHRLFFFAVITSFLIAILIKEDKKIKINDFRRGLNQGVAIIEAILSGIFLVKLIRLKKVWATMAAFTLCVDSIHRACKFLERTKAETEISFAEAIGFSDEDENESEKIKMGFDLRG